MIILKAGLKPGAGPGTRPGSANPRDCGIAGNNKNSGLKFNPHVYKQNFRKKYGKNYLNRNKSGQKAKTGRSENDNGEGKQQSPNWGSAPKRCALIPVVALP